MKEISFSYPYTEDDLLKFFTWQIYKKARFKIYQYIFLGLLIVQLLFSFITQDIDYLWLGLFVLLFSLLFIFVPLFYKYNVKKQFRTNPFLKSKIHYTINNEGITQSSDQFKTKYLWNQFHLVGETNTFFYLYITNNQALLIPKITLNQEIDEVRNQLFDTLTQKQCKYLYKKKFKA